MLDRCLQFAEPALLVGETGIGKTTVCQLAAFTRKRGLRIINCNQHTETSDFLGGYRPNRNREQAATAFRAALVAFNSLASSASLESLPEPSTTANAMVETVDEAFKVSAAAPPDIGKLLRQVAQELSGHVARFRAPFEWVDGPLVTAMREGSILLIDEINLAEDAVLERLNR